MIKQPVVKETYFTSEEVDTMVYYASRIQQPSPLENMGGSFGFRTSADADRLSIENPIAELTGDPKSDKSILKFTEAVLTVKKEMENFFSLEMSLANCNYTYLLPGFSSPVHADSSELDGTPYHEDEEMEYSALIYLNDYGIDYEGGELVFPLQELTIQPKKGMLVFFKGDTTNPHGVTEITKGERRVVILFFALKGNTSDRALFSDEYAGIPVSDFTEK
jgi:hypothetical protein